MENTKVNVVVAIDDVHPEKGWGIEGDVQVQYLEKISQYPLFLSYPF